MKKQPGGVPPQMMAAMLAARQQQAAQGAAQNAPAMQPGMKKGGGVKKFAAGGLTKIRGTGAATKGLNFHAND